MANLITTLQNTTQCGIYKFPHQPVPILEAAKKLRFAHFDISLQDAREKKSFLETVSHVLHFPDYFSPNWDAFEECLRDLSWHEAPGYVLVLEHIKKFATTQPKDYAVALEIMHNAIDFWKEQEVPFWIFIDYADAKFSLKSFPA